jgi:hypothetical protein
MGARKRYWCLKWPGAPGTLYETDQLSGIVVGGQGIYFHCLGWEAIGDHKDLRRHPGFEGMLDVVDERAPFLPWTIHTSPHDYAMAGTAMYSFRPRKFGAGGGTGGGNRRSCDGKDRART